ncbi:MAG: transcriptional regulator, partial [Pseudonocardiaceae bacterium]
MGEERLVDTFVELADTLIDDFDVIDFLHLLVDRCVEILDVDAAGLLLANQHGRLQVIATSNEQVRLLELF